MNDSLPFELLSRFLRGVSHEVRTPLSVISNELYVLQAESHDVRLSLEKVRQLDQILVTLQSLLSTDGEQTSISLEDLLQEVVANTEMTLQSHEPCFWNISRKQGVVVFGELFRIAHDLRLWNGTEIRLSKAGIYLPFLLSSPSEDETPKLLSTFLSPSGTLDAAILPLIDTIFLHNGILCEREPAGGLLLSQQDHSKECLG